MCIYLYALRTSVEIRLPNVSSEIGLDFKIFSSTKNLSKQKWHLQIRTCTVTDRTGRHFFQRSNGERSDPVHPSIQSWDRYFWSCSKRVFQLTVTLLTPLAVSSDTSSRLGRSATVVLVGTRANQTFNWHCISFEMKFFTSQLPVRLGVDPWMNATLAASVSK